GVGHTGMAVSRSRTHEERPMAIDPTTETLRSFAEAAQRLPALRGGKAVHPITLWRWSTRGIRTRRGVRVCLEAIKVGGTTCTSDQALIRFFHALTADASGVNR